MKIDLLADVPHDAVRSQTTRRLPALERCVARGESARGPGASFGASLLAEFGVRADDAPWAAIGLAGEGEEPGEHYWLRADPVSLQPTLHRVMVSGLLRDALDWPQAHALSNLLVPYLRDEGYELVLKHPQRWYVRCPSPQRLRTTSPPRDIVALDEALLPSGPDAGRWHRLMTEAQMLFFAAAADPTPDVETHGSVNGIWIWGGGVAPRIDERRYDATYSDDVGALGLARLSGSTAAALPGDARELVTSAASDSSQRVLVAIRAGADLQWLEVKWIAPLVALVMAGQVDDLTLRVFRPEGVLAYRATRGLLRRWWRRVRPLDRHV